MYTAYILDERGKLITTIGGGTKLIEMCQHATDALRSRDGAAFALVVDVVIIVHQSVAAVDTHFHWFATRKMVAVAEPRGSLHDQRPCE